MYLFTAPNKPSRVNKIHGISAVELQEQPRTDCHPPGAERSSEPAAADVATLVLPGGVLAAADPVGLREDGRAPRQLGTGAVGAADPARGTLTPAAALLPPLTLVRARRTVLQQEV